MRRPTTRGTLRTPPGRIARTQCLLSCFRRKSVTKNDTQERAVNVEAAVIFDVAQLPEFVHEQAYTASRCTNHFCQRFLGKLGHDLLRLFFFSVSSDQQEDSRQTLLA